MWSASDRYFDTIARTHDQLVKITVLKDGTPVASLVDGLITDPDSGEIVEITDGSIDVSSQMIRRSGTVEFLDTGGGLTPLNPNDLFAPFSTELRIWIGVRYWNATTAEMQARTDTEFIPVCTLIITHPQVKYPLITLQGYDRMWLLDNFTAPYNVPAGTNVADAMKLLIAQKVPANRLKTNFPGTESTTPNLTYDTDTPITDALQDIAKCAGWVAYVDPLGRFTADTIATTDTSPVIVYGPGQFALTTDHLSRDIGSEQFYNAVVFTSESGSTVPLRGYAEDDNPNSLTYVGNIGVRPLFASAPGLITQDQCIAAAQTKLQTILGISDAFVATIMPNHTHDAGDVLRLVDPSMSINHKSILDSFTINLRATAGAMALSCRANVIA